MILNFILELKVSFMYPYFTLNRFDFNFLGLIIEKQKKIFNLSGLGPKIDKINTQYYFRNRLLEYNFKFSDETS